MYRLAHWFIKTNGKKHELYLNFSIAYLMLYWTGHKFYQDAEYEMQDALEKDGTRIFADQKEGLNIQCGNLTFAFAHKEPILQSLQLHLNTTKICAVDGIPLEENHPYCTPGKGNRLAVKQDFDLLK